MNFFKRNSKKLFCSRIIFPLDKHKEKHKHKIGKCEPHYQRSISGNKYILISKQCVKMSVFFSKIAARKKRFFLIKINIKIITTITKMQFCELNVKFSKYHQQDKWRHLSVCSSHISTIFFLLKHYAIRCVRLTYTVNS